MRATRYGAPDTNDYARPMTDTRPTLNQQSATLNPKSAHRLPSQTQDPTVPKFKMQHTNKLPTGSGPKPGHNCRFSKEDDRPDTPPGEGNQDKNKSVLEYNWEDRSLRGNAYLEYCLCIQSWSPRGRSISRFSFGGSNRKWSRNGIRIGLPG